MKYQLDSSGLAGEKSQAHFLRSVNFLIYELLGDGYEFQTRLIDSGDFIISISGLPGEEKKKYRVNYDTSVFKLIYDVLYVALSNPSFFPGYGKSSSVFSVPSIEVPHWSLLNVTMSLHDPVFFDEDRKELHEFIYTLCIHFIIRHEIRHIANGHIDYLLNRGGNEFVEGFNNGLSPLDSQTFEMDVDSCVSVGFLHGLIDLPEQLNHIPEKLRSIENIFESFLFALKILFYCTPSNKVDTLEQARSLSHPNSTLRYFYAFTAGLSYLQSDHPDLFETFGKTYQRTWSFIPILGAQGVFNARRSMEDYAWSMSDEGQQHANNVWNNWNKWVPLLEPYALLKLAPPEK